MLILLKTSVKNVLRIRYKCLSCHTAKGLPQI
jgi:hypothetical protein